MKSRELTKWMLCFSLACGVSALGCKSDDGAEPSENEEEMDQGRGDAGDEPEQDAGPASAADAGTGGDDEEWVSSRGQCDIDSGFLGDDTCLLPPPPGKGIQIHI